MEQFQAKTINGFLSKSECETLLNYAKTTDMWKPIPNDFWDKRTINYRDLPKNIKELCEKIILRLQTTLHSEYNLEEKIYPDTIDVVRWFDGMKQTPHCDDMSDNEEQHKRFGERYFGCVIYLNDDYQGGKTYYPEHNFEITPKAGTVAMHLGDCNHKHGVTELKGNTRYTIASFWGFNKNKALPDIEYV